MKKPAVLFLCTGNSARSQMAEALLRHEAGDRFDVYSAGTQPKGVHPLTLEALQELGIATEPLRSKPVSEFLGRLPVRYLIVVCDNADRECPSVWPGVVQRLFWPFPDPAAASPAGEPPTLAGFRAVRDQIHARVKTWLAESATYQVSGDRSQGSGNTADT